MKTSQEYYNEALKDLGATEDYSVPIQAATDLALIKAMKDFLEELPDLLSSLPFQFDENGSLLVKERNY